MNSAYFDSSIILINFRHNKAIIGIPLKRSNAKLKSVMLYT